jgi:hypothetical protein
MGAAASLINVELTKPADASDIRDQGSLEFAKSEVVRLRGELGHLARAYGVEILSFDASDLVLGDNDEEDFQRCVREIAHVRQCLRLNTQQSVRSQRTRNYPRQYSTGQLPTVRDLGMASESKSDSKCDDDQKKRDDDDSGSSSDSD